MCQNQECPMKESCYRFTAPVGHWQSYMGYQVKEGEDRCESFIDNKPWRK